MQNQNLIDLNHIEKNAVARELNESLKGMDLNLSARVVALPDGYKLQNLEGYEEYRNRMRGSFKTEVLADFAEYVTDNLDEESMGAGCFISAEDLKANCVLDLGTVESPLHCEHKAALQLKQSPEYVAMQEINGVRKSQKDLAEWFEDWTNCLAAFDTNGESMTPQQLIASVRNISIEAVRNAESTVEDFSESMSALERIEAKNKDRQPAKVLFTCKPADELEERTFSMRISISTGGDRPMLTLRVQQLEVMKNQIADEFKCLVKESLKDTPVKTYVGTGSF